MIPIEVKFFSLDNEICAVTYNLTIVSLFNCNNKNGFYSAIS